MEQLQQGYSDSTPRADSDDYKNRRALQLISICQISTQKYGSGRLDPF